MSRKQTGGSHYADRAIQPIDYIHANELTYMEGNVVKYITRHRFKNGAEDILKIKDYCDMILEKEYGQESERSESNLQRIAAGIKKLGRGLFNTNRD